MNEKKNKHMTLSERTEIQDCLYKRMTFKAIASLIEKDPTTVSKEVKLHAQNHANSFVTNDEICPKLLKVPFVCNGCKQKSSYEMFCFLYSEKLASVFNISRIEDKSVVQSPKLQSSDEFIKTLI